MTLSGNPIRILATLDRHLRSPLTLYVYGRSALALGFPDAPAQYQATLDVDAILPARDVQALEKNSDFWDAQQRTNEELGEAGLYFTHLFEDRQVILSPDWLEHVVELRAPGFTRLRLFRPSTIDLVLTKMMRIDPQDRDDIKFLVGQADFRPQEFESALQRAAVPAVAEIGEAFLENAAWMKREGLR